MPQLTTPHHTTHQYLRRALQGMPFNMQLLTEEGFDRVPVLDDVGHVIGVVTEGTMTQRKIN